MGCVLTVYGKDLDVDALESTSGLTPKMKRYKGELMGDKVRTFPYSFLSLPIGDEDHWDNLEAQVKDVLDFIGKHQEELGVIATFEGVDDIELDFGIDNKNKQQQTCRLSAELIKEAAKYNMTFHISIYDL